MTGENTVRKIDTCEIENAVYRLARKAGVTLTASCVKALEKAEREETGAASAFSLKTILKNKDIAAAEEMPVCQDTGMAVVMLDIGQEVFLEGKFLSDAINDGVRRAYKDGYFRKSVCDPLSRVNTADNTPAVIHTDIVVGDKVKITFMPKGFGSENMSKLYMLTPSKGIEGVIDSIVETVKVAGSRPCPPVYVGVIGSKKKIVYVNGRLREAGISEEAIKQVHTPIGLDIGAVTPEEIAVSIAGELIMIRAKRRDN